MAGMMGLSMDAMAPAAKAVVRPRAGQKKPGFPSAKKGKKPLMGAKKPMMGAGGMGVGMKPMM